MATFCEEFLGNVLHCADYRQCDRLNTILLDAVQVYEYCSDNSNFTFDGVLSAVYSAALDYLTEIYRAACEGIERYKSGTYTDTEIPLIKEALDFINPREDLHIENDSSGVYLELDYWDLYSSVVDSIVDDLGLSKKSFGEFLSEFTYNVYGGKRVPDKFESLI